MSRLISVLVFSLLVSCSNHEGVKNDNHTHPKEVSHSISNGCEIDEIVTQINQLIDADDNYDSILEILDNSYLPLLIKVQYKCPAEFRNISIKALLKYHKSELLNGHSNGMLISNKSYEFLCLILFQSGYMEASGNFDSSSRTTEVLQWAINHKNSLSKEVRFIVNEIEAI